MHAARYPFWRGTTIVSGPGQKCAASREASSTHQAELFSHHQPVHMADQRIETRASLHCENLGNGLAIGCICCQPVDGLGGMATSIPVSQRCNCSAKGVTTVDWILVVSGIGISFQLFARLTLSKPFIVAFTPINLLQKAQKPICISDQKLHQD